MIRTLAIETSCDDTSVGIISFDGKKFEVEKMLAYSQISDHQMYGGVVPEIASRLHCEKIIAVLEEIGFENIKTVDFVSVTSHPGLPGALVVGKATANLIAKFFDKPVIEVNHIYGHVFSLLLERSVEDIEFPLVVLTASGGHNDVYVVEDVAWKYQITKIGQTLDDAAGECFDKVSRMLGGPYPGGQWISERALHSEQLTTNMEQWNKNEKIQFKRIFLSKEGFDFSFSWMKSQVFALLQEYEKNNVVLNEELICEIAYEFQEAVVEVLAKKLIRAWIKYEVKMIGIAGGVSCNERLRQYLNEQLITNNKKLDQQLIALRPVKKIYSTDNAAMIGVVGILSR